MRNKVQLITYADRLAGDLQGLADLLGGPLAGIVEGVHVLPFFTPIDGSDAGFDPSDHRVVDPRLGRWDDVRTVGTNRDLMADLIVNHVSADSPQFRDVLKQGDDSPHADMFLRYGDVFPGGASEEELLAIYRPRPGMPFTTYGHADGSKRLYWTTFTSTQLDVDVRSPRTRAYLREILDTFADARVDAIRLDAVGYAVKERGTSCFMTPATFAFIDELTAECRERGIEVLVEIHSHHSQQVQVAAQVDWVYDFALPPLVLHAIFTGRTAALRRWLHMRPTNAVTVLDTHDGIGVRDVGPDQMDRSRAGLLADHEIDELVEGIHARTGGESRQATGAAASNVDLYQVNSTYLDALGGDHDAHLLARAIQVFVPGVPQVYYVGLLGARNDMELLRATGVGRDINRHRFTPGELAGALRAPHNRRLFALLHFRNTFPAFDGEWTLLDDDPDGAPGVLAMRWDGDDTSCTLRADLAAASRGRPALHVEVTDTGGTRTVTDPLELPA